MIRRTVVLASISVLFLATGCSSSPDATSPDATSNETSTPGITVAAASSLADVFPAIAAEFTAQTGIAVAFSFAGSSAIAEQVRGGAPIDVFASAGASSMDPLVQEQWVSDAQDFATNSLVIAVPAGNPGGVRAMQDLTRVTLVVCQEQVPCGVAARTFFDKNGLTVTPASFEPDVRSVLTKVSTDEADAGIVYVTDIAAAEGLVEAVAIPAEANVSTTYQAAVVAESAHRDSAAAFVDFLNAPAAQAQLRAAGFGAAP